MKHHLFFLITGIAGLLLLGIATVLYVFFVDQPVNSSLVVTPKTTVSPSSDPLVSVVPKVSETEISKGAPIALPSDPKRGATEPKVTIIEFGDFQCENCAAMKNTLATVLSEYPETVQHVWKDYPLANIHQYAEIAAIAGRCAAEQDKFWEYHDALLDAQSSFITQPWNTLAADVGLDVNTFSACVGGATTERLVVQSYFVGQSIGIDEVPTYFVNGKRLNGAQSADSLRAVIDEALNQ
jgi:protein-disulfide isomerase